MKSSSLAVLFPILLGSLLLLSDSSSDDRSQLAWAWAESGDRVVLEWATLLLAGHGLHSSNLDELSLEPGTSLRYSLRGGDLAHFVDGSLRISAGFVFHSDAGQAFQFDALELAPVDGVLVLREVDGDALFDLFQPMVRLDQPGRLLIEGAGLVARQQLAKRLNTQHLSGMTVGQLRLVVRADNVERSGEPSSSCSVPVWPGAEGRVTDVEMISLGQYAPNWGCSGSCTGESDNAFTWWSPSAELENVGTADVPWYDWFSSNHSQPKPPYGNRQHPLLVWNLYRINTAGAIEQIGRSGVKHGYYTSNYQCGCWGGNVLWAAPNTPNQAGCRDTYSAANNNVSIRLGPRSEIIPVEAIWGRCGSVWDPDCSGVTSAHEIPAPAHRMLVRESDLAAAENLDAQYLLEAWYLVRDDDHPNNNLRHVAVATSWNTENWNPLTFLDSQIAGPAIDSWVAPGRTALTDHQALVTELGRVRLALRVQPLSNGQFRYDYALMNLDFAVPETEGNEPDLRVLANNGFRGFVLDLEGTISIDNIDFADGVNPSSNWPAEQTSAYLAWRAPDAASSLDWGSLYRFTLVADRPPAPITASIEAGAPGDERVYSIEILGPSDRWIFHDAFKTTQL